MKTAIFGQGGGEDGGVNLTSPGSPLMHASACFLAERLHKDEAKQGGNLGETWKCSRWEGPGGQKDVLGQSSS